MLYLIGEKFVSYFDCNTLVTYNEEDRLMTFWDIDTRSATNRIIVEGINPDRILPVGKRYVWLRENNYIFVIDVETGNAITDTKINFDDTLTNNWVFVKETGEVFIVLSEGKLTIFNSKTGTYYIYILPFLCNVFKYVQCVL